jgi:hypothetical protein
MTTKIITIPGLIAGAIIGAIGMYLYIDDAMHKAIARSAYTAGQADNARSTLEHVLGKQMEQIVDMEANRPEIPPVFLNTVPTAKMGEIKPAIGNVTWPYGNKCPNGLNIVFNEETRRFYCPLLRHEDIRDKLMPDAEGMHNFEPGG